MFQKKFANITVLAAALLVGLSNTAFAATKLEFVEQAISYSETDGGEPGNSVEDALTVDSILLDPNTKEQKGTKHLECLRTSQKQNGDLIVSCNETIYLPDGKIYTEGEFNETGKLNQFKPTKLDIVGGEGAYAGAKGKEQIIAIRLPDQYSLELVIN